MQTTVEQATTITRQGDRGKLYFYGDIVSSWWGAWDNTDQYPERIRDFLSGQTGPLDIYINSFIFSRIGFSYTESNGNSAVMHFIKNCFFPYLSCLLSFTAFIR